jgi:hypothetical protein
MNLRNTNNCHLNVDRLTQPTPQVNHEEKIMDTFYGSARLAKDADQPAQRAQGTWRAIVIEPDGQLHSGKIYLENEDRMGVIATINISRGKDGREGEANAAFIARACKTHDALVAALGEAAEFVQIARQHFPKSIRNADRFKLEQTSAAIGTAIAAAKS